MENLINIIQNVGFPIAMALFFMFKLDKSISNNTKALIEIQKIIHKCEK